MKSAIEVMFWLLASRTMRSTSGVNKADHQDRADIDGQEVEAGLRREADRTEKGPGRAIDRQARADRSAGAGAVRRAQNASGGRHSSPRRTATRYRPSDRDNDPGLQASWPARHPERGPAIPFPASCQGNHHKPHRFIRATDSADTDGPFVNSAAKASDRISSIAAVGRTATINRCPDIERIPGVCGQR